MNWTGIVSHQQVKEQLPLEYVCWREGITLESTYDGRLVGRCPFHDDEHASFAVFGERLEKVGCWSCDFQSGDLYELLMRVHGITFTEAATLAALYLREFKDDDEWRAKPRVIVEKDPETLRDVARQAWVNGAMNLEPLEDLINIKHWEFDAEWLHREWWVGVSPPVTVVIPHLNARSDVTGVKLRTRAFTPAAIWGSRFPQLYGVWRGGTSRSLLLVEGESDSWTASWRYPTYDVLGLQTGAMTYPRMELAQPLSRYDKIFIAFDGDEAGRAGATRWQAALGDRATVVDVPDGEDVTSWKALQLP